MKLTNLGGVLSPARTTKADDAVREAEELRDRAHRQRQAIERLSARVDALVASAHAIQDDLAELLL